MPDNRELDLLNELLYGSTSASLVDHWRRGDWISLSAVDVGQIANDAQREQLALFILAGHVQAGKLDDAKTLLGVIQEWGCDRKAAFRVLISCIHDSLARVASLLGQKARALEHFRSAIELQALGHDIDDLTQARMNNDELLRTMTQNSNARNAATHERQPSNEERPRADTTGGDRLLCIRAEPNHDLYEELRRNSEVCDRVCSRLEGVVRREILNAVKQLEAFVNINGYVSNELDFCSALPWHGWAISPDFGLELISVIDRHDYDVILEFGSGSSTAVIAKAVRSAERRKPCRSRIKFLSFDHLITYCEVTRENLRRLSLLDVAEVVHAPLADWQSSDGVSQPFYSCSDALESVAAQIRPATCRVLVVVDGPPGTTSPYARYPALPVTMEYFPDAEIDILMDDCNRADERAIVSRWSSDLECKGAKCTVRELPLEKGAAFIEIRRSTSGCA